MSEPPVRVSHRLHRTDDLYRRGETVTAAATQAGFGTFNRKMAEILHAIALFDAHSLAQRFGARPTAGWMVRALSISNFSAHEYVKVARAMRDFPKLGTAFRDGDITYSKVRLLRPYLTSLDEDELVRMATTMTYPDLEMALLKYREGATAPTRKSSVRVVPRADGTVAMWATFTAAERARLKAALKVGELAWHDVDWEELKGPGGRLSEEKVDRRLCAAGSPPGAPGSACRRGRRWWRA